MTKPGKSVNRVLKRMRRITVSLLQTGMIHTLVASGLMISALAAAENPEIRISADNQFYYAHDGHNEDEAFRDLMEDWAAVTFGYGGFEANAEYEAHLPQPSWSRDTTGQGIYERWITYKHDGFSATLGNFYAQLGRGLTLKSFRNRDLRYTTNIDGAQFSFSNRIVDLTALGGRPRDLTGLRMNPLQAAEIRLTPLSLGFLGITYVQSKLFNDTATSRIGSAYLNLQKDFGSLYAEVASRNPASADGAGHGFLKGAGSAFYATGNLFLWRFSVIAEAASYDSFDISRGVEMYNSPPPAFKEHSTALMSRVMPSLLANNHVSLHMSTTYALNDENNVSLDLTRSRAVRDGQGERRGIFALARCTNIFDTVYDYSDIFAKGEFVFPSSIDWIAGSGFQKTLSESFLNFVVNGDWGVFDNHSLQGVFEHQLATAAFERKYFNQQYSLTLARASAPRVSITGIAEYTSDQTSDRHFWFGTQINWSFFDNDELVVFAGNRKKGKICAGGVCVVKPEFSGVEVTFTSRW
jgi:hypothetical protein